MAIRLDFRTRPFNSVWLRSNRLKCLRRESVHNKWIWWMCRRGTHHSWIVKRFHLNVPFISYTSYLNAKIVGFRWALEIGRVVGCKVETHFGPISSLSGTRFVSSRAETALKFNRASFAEKWTATLDFHTNEMWTRRWTNDGTTNLHENQFKWLLIIINSRPFLFTQHKGMFVDSRSDAERTMSSTQMRET